MMQKDDKDEGFKENSYIDDESKHSEAKNQGDQSRLHELQSFEARSATIDRKSRLHELQSVEARSATVDRKSRLHELQSVEARSATVDRKSRLHELLRLWKEYTVNQQIDDTTIKEIASELCTLLVKTKSYEALVAFLSNLPSGYVDESSNENIIRAKLSVALFKKETVTVYKILKEHKFESDTEDLIKIWDEAHYIDEEKRTKRKLTPLARFRVRKRFPPPKSICWNGIRKTNTLPREATSFLKAWLADHLNDPYPSALEKQRLAEISGLTQAQVKTWFANARRRGKNFDDEKKFDESWSLISTHDEIRRSVLKYDDHLKNDDTTAHANNVLSNAMQNLLPTPGVVHSVRALHQQYRCHDYPLDRYINNDINQSHEHTARILDEYNTSVYYAPACYLH